MSEEGVTQVAGPDYLVAGRYRLRSRLGGGGMGTVWLANDTLLNREVALKQIGVTDGLEATAAEIIRKRAMHEGRIVSHLKNKHITKVHDVTLDKGEPWIVLEYLPSCSLAQVLHMTGTLPPHQVAQIGAQVADAMVEAHSDGILHRDIKPGNILIADRGAIAGTVKISDFGIARSIRPPRPDEAGDAGSAGEAGATEAAGAAGTDHTELGWDVIVGTPAYFSPEVARGQEPTRASDVFSLGAALYTALEGFPPFGVDDDPVAMLHKAARGEVIAPRCEDPVIGVVLDMLQPDPSRRPSMAEARDGLALVAAGADLDPAVILDAPLLATDGRIPVWVRRAGGIRQRSKSVPGSTVGGLVAVAHATPLSQVPSPQTPSSVLGQLPWRTTKAEPVSIPADASAGPRKSSEQVRSKNAWLPWAALGLVMLIALVLALALF